MTNIGAYAPNILQYYFLKADPELDWTFNSNWMDPGPRNHIDLIRASRQDFVIAGQRDNGLTYSPFALPAEDAVFDAMWQDPGYMAIDRFYGLNGREMAIFARRGNFGGWRPVSGILNHAGKRDDQRDSPDGLAYLETFAARPVQADLEVEWAGVTSGQKLSVFVNYQKAAESTFTTESTSSSFKQEISLARGTNEIVLQSNGPVTFRYLLIVPRLVTEPPVQGISVAWATYGGNCGAPQGNATVDAAVSCNGKPDCTYLVDVERLGDPAGGCGKDFEAAFFCSSRPTMQHAKLAGEATSKVVTLSCARDTGAEAEKRHSEGLDIRSATYGGNCGAPRGNATQDVATSCGGKADCTYSVSVDKLGDPASGCSKNFVVSYLCAPSLSVLEKELAGEAGFGGVLNLSCTRPRNDQ
jgi:hypothetical protein